MNKSNLFKQAHKLAKATVKTGDSYSATFALCLKSLIAYRKTLESKHETIVDLNKDITPLCKLFVNVGLMNHFAGDNGDYDRYYFTNKASIVADIKLFYFSKNDFVDAKLNVVATSDLRASEVKEAFKKLAAYAKSL